MVAKPSVLICTVGTSLLGHWREKIAYLCGARRQAAYRWNGIALARSSHS